MQPLPVPVPVPPPAGLPLAIFLLLALAVAMPLTGMILGFRALKAIRQSEGRLGGAWLAAWAAGLVPALCLVAVTAAGFTLLMETLLPSSRPRSELWLAAGVSGGAWLSWLMLRRLHREATGWTAPRSLQTGRSPLAAVATVLTIVGAACLLFTAVRGNPVPLTRESFRFLNFIILLGGLICGVLARHTPAGKACAWISGILFTLLLA